MSIQGDDVSIPLTPVTTTSTEVPSRRGTKRRGRRRTRQFYKSIFDKADADNDGHISVRELRQMIDDNELAEESLSKEMIKRMHKRADEDQDGLLNLDEFIAMVHDPDLRPIFGKYIDTYVKYVIPKKLRAGGYDATDLEYEDEYTCCPPKLGMIIISLVEVIFFLIDEFNEENSTLNASGPMAKVFIYDPKRRYEVWRYLTYMFVHIGYLHLVVNLAVQIFIGLPLEMVHGWWRLLTVYAAGVVAGSLGTSLTDPNVKLAGASGGVYSLITAHIATIILNWSEMTFPLVQLCIFLLITGVDVGTSIYNRYYENLADNVGYAAHFAGAVAGLLVGINVLRNLKKNKIENYIWWISLTVYTGLMIIAVCWNIGYSGYFPEQVYT